jgi:hypothetical protein
MIPIEILRIKDELRDGYHVLCRVHIKGKEFRMLVDTGSSITIFNIDKAEEISDGDTEINKQEIIAVGGKVESKYIVIDEMRIGDIIIKDYKTILLSLNHLNDYLKKNGEPLIDGLLGGDILHDYKAIINYESREMILS